MEKRKPFRVVLKEDRWSQVGALVILLCVMSMILLVGWVVF
jgi:hypothetical protein